jgi:hypothetical protein
MRKWKLTAMAVASACCVGSSAKADIVTFTVNGTWGSLGADVPADTNVLAPLVGAGYTLSESIGTNSAYLIRSETNLSVTPPIERAWFFSTTSGISTGTINYSHGLGGVVADAQDNFAYDGSGGLLPAGSYDVIELTGWARGSGPAVDPIACPDRGIGPSLLGDSAPGPCSLAGPNLAVDLTIIGTANLFSGISSIPFGSLDLSQVLYVQTEAQSYFNGIETGDIRQDPPVSYVDGAFVGPGISMAVVDSPTPEPATWALMAGGFGLAGAALRRRRAAVVA